MKLLVAGDVTAKGRIGGMLKAKRYDDVFAGLSGTISQADYAILNLETPIVMHDTYEPIPKVGPHLGAPAEIVEMVKKAGFHAVTLANNHILDYGSAALMDTLQLLDEKGIDHVGAGRNLEDASKVLVKTFGDKKLAIVNFCEAEFSIAEENESGAFPIDVVKNVRQIQQAKANADFVVVIVHGGIELYPLPSPRMRELYRFYVDMGADVVLNHHQHCYSGYEVYGGKLIFYGLGNLCFDTEVTNDSKRHIGIMACLSLSDNISFEIIPYRQCDKKAAITLLEKEEKEIVMADIHRLNGVIADDAALRKEYGDLVDKKALQVHFRFSPFFGKVALKLAVKGILKVRPSQRKALRMLEYLNCDSHRDIAGNVFANSLKK